MNSAPDIPGHTVTSVLGTGGFAAVYRGWQRAVGREVAIKIDNRVLFSERDRRRFFREVTAAGRLSGHPHVIDVYDAGMLGDGRPYLVMELCPGGSLNDELRRHGPMSAQRVTWIGVRLADALAAAHAAGVLHRDIKPANILVNRYGVVGLADFGLASIIAASGEQTVTRDALTPAFAPPESFRQADPTTAADIYSLAATLYMLLAGRPPRFPAGEPPPALAAIASLHDQPVEDVPGAPPALMAILRQGLAPDPAQRPPTAAALRDALAALDRALGGQPMPGRSPAAGSQPSQGQPPVPGAPAPPASWGSGPAPAPPPSWGSGPAPAPPPSWGSGPAPDPAASGAPVLAPAPAAPWTPATAGPPAGWEHGIPATGDYWSTAGSSRSGGYGTEGAPGRPAAGSAGPMGRTGPVTGQAGGGVGQVSLGQAGAGQVSLGQAGAGQAGAGQVRAGQAGAGFGTGDGPGGGWGQAAPAGPATQPPARRRPVALMAALSGGLVLVVVAALFAGAHFLGRGPAAGPGASQPGRGAGSVPAVFGVPTVTGGCPAASAGTSGARCPSSPECWNGTVEFSGNTSARSLPCTGPHVWETFAIGILPASATTFDQSIVAANPTVRAVCSVSVLLKSRAGAAQKIPAASWEIEVLPPDEAAFDSGARAYRCLARILSGPDATMSQFLR